MNGTPLEGAVLAPMEGLAGAVSSGFSWMPGWLVTLLVLIVPALVALAIYQIAILLVARIARERATYLRTVMARLRGPARLAIVILAMSASLRVAAFEPAIESRLAHALLIAFILLVGWAALTAVHVSSELYLRRFSLDSEDNLLARKHYTQIRVLRRAVDTLVGMITLASALTTFEGVREYGVSLFASAGAAGLVVGLAARPVLSNLIAGIQLAVTQPIRIDDAVVVEGEWGWIQEITGTYVVIRLWDWRRLIVPLSYFIEKPFQNWTREQAGIIGTVLLRLDYSVPVAKVREKLEEVAAQSRLWDGQVVNLQVTDAGERTIELRCLVSGRNAPQTWDLRCEVREKLIEFLQAEYPGSLPRQRLDMGRWDGASPPASAPETGLAARGDGTGAGSA